MKKIILFSAILFFVSCSKEAVKTTSPESIVIEKTVLWDVKQYGKGSEPTELIKIVKNNPSFVKEGHFYKDTKSRNIFGHKCRYIGLEGIDVTPGVNVTLEGSPESIMKNIEKNQKVKFKKHGEVYVHEISSTASIVIVKHPNLQGCSIIVAAYTGL